MLKKHQYGGHALELEGGWGVAGIPADSGDDGGLWEIVNG